MKNRTTLFLGIIWLLVAAALLVYLFVNPTTPTVQWETETEQNTAGFQIYRSDSSDGEFELITENYIPSEGSSVTGGSYSYEDESAVPGQTYYYLLEEIELDGTTNRYMDDVISQHVSYINGWIIGLIAFITLVGIGLVVIGIREGR